MLNGNVLCKLLGVLYMLGSKSLLGNYYECDTVLERTEDSAAERSGSFLLRPCFVGKEIKYTKIIVW